MKLRIPCPDCGTPAEVSDEQLGQHHHCGSCGKDFLLWRSEATDKPGDSLLLEPEPEAPAEGLLHGMLSLVAKPRRQKVLAWITGGGFLAGLAALFLRFPRGTALEPLVGVMGKFHPLILHLPIGFLLGAVVLEYAGGRSHRHSGAVTGLLWLSLLSGIPAVFAGYLLGVGGDYNGSTLDFHLWSGISVPVLTFLTLLAKLKHDSQPAMTSSGFYRLPLLCTAAALTVAGHLGATLTHGDLLTDVQRALKAESQAATPVDERTVYEAVIAPVLDSKCTGCHGAEKSKGDLRMHTLEDMLKAGESEKAAVVPGNSAGSEAIVRVLLPIDDEDHMPPEKKPQLTADETEVLKWWIDSGAKADVKLKDAAVPDALKDKVMAIVNTAKPVAAPAPAPAPSVSVAPVDNTAVQALEKELGVAILPVAQDDPALTFNCVNVADKFGDAELAKFAPLAGRLVEMNLARSKVTDAGLASLAGMTNLKKLHLQGTAVTDAGIDSILTASGLEYLNLFNTKVTDAGFSKLEKLPALKKVYVWQTGVTPEAAEALHGKLPDIVVNLGWDKEVKTVVAPPPAPEPAPAPAPETPAPVAAAADPEQPVYAAIIAPIFMDKCAGCHGEKKQKGKLAMHTIEAIMKGGDSGEATVVPGKSADSLIVKRALLPDTEDEHMPPAKKPQLSDKELGLIKWWIDAGAKTDVKIKDAGLPDNLK